MPAKTRVGTKIEPATTERLRNIREQSSNGLTEKASVQRSVAGERIPTSNAAVWGARKESIAQRSQRGIGKGRLLPGTPVAWLRNQAKGESIAQRSRVTEGDRKGETAAWDTGGLAAESGEGESIAQRSQRTQRGIGVGGTKLLPVTVGLGENHAKRGRHRTKGT